MESTLEKLLRIQGGHEQISIETAPSPPAPPPDQHGPGGAGAARQAAQAQPTAQQEKPSPEMLEAWRGAFRAFTKYAQPLRLAAHKQDENEEAAALFTAAAEDVKAIYAAGGDAEIIALGVYGMLEDVFRREQQQKAP